jgi:hypothetical protein
VTFAAGGSFPAQDPFGGPIPRTYDASASVKADTLAFNGQLQISVQGT